MHTFCVLLTTCNKLINLIRWLCLQYTCGGERLINCVSREMRLALIEGCFFAVILQNGLKIQVETEWALLSAYVWMMAKTFFNVFENKVTFCNALVKNFWQA